MRGGYTRNPHFYKHGFRTFFRKEYGAGKLRYPVFGAEGADRFDNLDFRTTANHSWARRAARDSDPSKHTFVRDVFARDTQAIIGQPYTRSRYYHLYLNGVYWGVYQSQERPKAAYGETYFGGDKDDYDAVKCANRVAGYSTEATDGTMDAWHQLWDLAVSMRDNPSEATYRRMTGCDPDGTRNPTLPVLLDPENLIDYMLIIFYMGDGDAPLSRFLRYQRANNWHSLYHREGDQGFQFFCHDGEHTMDVPTAIHDRTGPFNVGLQRRAYSNPEWIHQNLLGSAEYRMLFADRAHRLFFNDGALTVEKALARLKKRANQGGAAMIAQSARWGDAQRSHPFTIIDWELAINNVVRQFIPGRTKTVVAQLTEAGLYPKLAAPMFSQHGGTAKSKAQVTVKGPSTIIYSLDGSDPRLPGGGINSATQQTNTATVTLTLDKTTTIMARSRSEKGEWSALTSARFLVDEAAASMDNLTITEVMYRPDAPNEAEKKAGYQDRSAFEFIEMRNTGKQAIDLTDVVFTNGVTFDFNESAIRTLASQEHLLVVKNQKAFEHRYGKGLPIAGEYTGRLSNGGEALGIRAADLSPIAEFVYNDKAPWPEKADGDGYSLTQKNPSKNRNLGDPAHWTASSRQRRVTGQVRIGECYGNIDTQITKAFKDCYLEA